MSDQNQEAKKIQGLFREANAMIEGPSPYLKTRVLAHLREKKSRSFTFSWKWFAAFSSATSLALAVLVFNKSSPADFSAQAGLPVLVKVEVEQVKSMQVAYAEIVLPDGVYFYSAKYPELKEQRTLSLAWEDSFNQAKLPFVVRSDIAGVQEIKILMKDANNTIIQEKKVVIAFKG